MLTALLVVLSAAPVRVAQVSPVNHEGAPTDCVAARCGFELMADGRLFSAQRRLRVLREGPLDSREA